MALTTHIKRFFFRGLAVLLPTFLTIWILIWGFRFIQGNISNHINNAAVDLVMVFRGYQGEAARESIADFWIRGWGSITGFIVALLIVLVVGALLASVVGKTLWKIIEKFIMRTPVFKQVYPYIKQITDFLLTEEKLSFSRVVGVEYPRKGIWSLGFVTGTGLKKLTDKLNYEILTILIPTSPTPFTGFVIMVPKDETIELDMTIEEALRFVVSGGVITPSNRKQFIVTGLSEPTDGSDDIKDKKQ
ncbi:MAG: DUF502 domain-containing protein [Phycisphaerae bacterium]|nr:DUF502 domain-containing protein [Phycisphaerae bacterium]